MNPAEQSRAFLNRYADHTLLTAKEEVNLAHRVAEGDTSARRSLVEHNMRLVMSIAGNFRNQMFGMEYEDAVHEGVVGLERAIDKFDPDRGFRFTTYATWWIRQAIQRAIANKSRTIRTPVHVDDRRFKARTYIEQNPEASDEEVATALGIEIHQLLQALSAPGMTASLNAPHRLDNGDGAELGDTLPDLHSIGPEDSALTEASFGPVRRAVATLDPDVRHAIELRFGFGDGVPRAITEISAALDVPGYVATRLVRTGIVALRETLETWYNENRE